MRRVEIDKVDDGLEWLRMEVGPSTEGLIRALDLRLGEFGLEIEVATDGENEIFRICPWEGRRGNREGK